MGKLSWYKRDPVAALEGMSNLTMEERGAYNTLLDLIYARGGAVDDDDRFIAGWQRCDVRVWRRIRARLIDLEKIYVLDGSLRNSKADAVVDEALAKGASVTNANRIKGQKSGAARRRIKDLDEPGANRKRTESDIEESEPEKEEVRKKESDAGASSRSQSDWPGDGFEQFWRAYPHKVGKQAALKAFAAAKRSGAPWRRVIFSLERYVAEKPRDRAWCNPATWLNQGRWDDDPAPPVQPRAGPQRGNGFVDLAHQLGGDHAAHISEPDTGPIVEHDAGDGGQLDFGPSRGPHH